MSERTTPTPLEWKTLYQAADAFKKAAPWQWLWDQDLICVENPENGMVGYCSIMGRGGEHFAIGVYLGNMGIYGFCTLGENADRIPHHEFIHLQDCIMCSFEDREYVTPEDKKVINELGLKYRGRSAWPVFRRYEPGFYPWYISSEECRFLTTALQQAIISSLEIRDGKISMDMRQNQTVIRRKDKATDTWDTSRMDLNYPEMSYSPIEINDEFLLAKLKKLQRNKSAAIEVGITYMPVPIGDKGERPYFPRLFMVADANSRLLLTQEMYENIKQDANTVLNGLIELFMKMGLPGTIYSRGDISNAILGDLCEKTNIKLKIVDNLPTIDEIIDEMCSRM